MNRVGAAGHPGGVSTARRRTAWHAGERAAWEAYRRRGYRLVARNWRCPLGEIDLVLSRDDVVVVCEVKTRTSAAMGPPHEAVNPAKQHKVRTVAEAFLAARGLRESRCRLDVASVRLLDDGRAEVRVFEDAF
jgi:putative endonuclease